MGNETRGEDGCWDRRKGTAGEEARASMGKGVGTRMAVGARLLTGRGTDTRGVGRPRRSGPGGASLRGAAPRAPPVGAGRARWRGTFPGRRDRPQVTREPLRLRPCESEPGARPAPPRRPPCLPAAAAPPDGPQLSSQLRALPSRPPQVLPLPPPRERSCRGLGRRPLRPGRSRRRSDAGSPAWWERAPGSCPAGRCHLRALSLTAIVITEQPVSVAVPVGHSFSLRCRAEGRTALRYQWFCQCQSVCQQIPGATKEDLPITAQQSQLYTCRVNDLHKNCIFSDWVKVEVHQCVARGLPPQLWHGEPLIVLNPTAQRLEAGRPLQLRCAAMGVPAPSYQWYRNGNLLEHQKRKKLWIAQAQASDSGTYLCCASNSHGQHWSSAVDVLVGPCCSEKFFATGKVALLVGNNRYRHHPSLMAPVRDVFELRLLLEQLSFQVVSLLDLNKAEMVAAVSQFLQLLGKGVYAVFYYAGHGYEHLGRNYMVPVDAPQPYTPENCISVQRILQKMQQQETALNLILLDTCRKWYNPGGALSQVQPLQPWGNTVYGYATSEDAEAYELQDGELSSGIFMKYLKKHILQEKKVTRMLEDVLEAVGQDPLVAGRQVMEIKHTLKEPRTLTDPLCPSAPAAQRWGHSRELLSRVLTFSCGAEVELHCHWLFSNVLHICAKLLPTSAHLAEVLLLLRRAPGTCLSVEGTSERSCSPWAPAPPGQQPPSAQAEDRDNVATPRQSHPDLLGSLLAYVCKQEMDCTLQLPALQQIQADVVLQLDLHYRQRSSTRRTQESLQTTLQRALLGQGCSQGTAATHAWLQPAVVLSTDPKGQAHLRAGSGHSLPSSSPSTSSQPEENDESDLSQLCSALQQTFVLRWRSCVLHSRASAALRRAAQRQQPSTREPAAGYNPGGALSQVQPLQPWGNTVYGYAT
ncbi:mucosa-associated lymphoid tissue lymphoma translocation protein 1-like [Indicator indicator]|uniref:mucosa-associated lymphoid tissue lymphoma translocation protein 1-like n=1 Tax=Indicator indicator TaxID=1002788 RepID=UPI0023DF1941|nr:mucosa-associated lymphoid tissue lymphoma translocation protein 1-like [Indicator indicator]